MLLFSFWNDIIKPILDGLVAQFIAGMATGIPKLISALVIFFIGLTIASFVRNIVGKVLGALGIDKLTQRLHEIDLVQSTGMKVQLSQVIAKVIHFFIVFMFTMMTIDVLNIEAISKLMQDAFNYLPSLLTAGVILVIGLFLADLLKGITLAALQSLNIPSAKVIAGVVFYFMFISIAVSALAQAKIETAFIAANLTVIIAAAALAFSIGYGLAAKDLASNYLAGFYNKNKVRVNDEVVIDGHQGKVVLVDNSSLILQSKDRAIIVPLSKLTTTNIEVIYALPKEGQKQVAPGKL
jgi:hypothetical protein